jgi:tetratricopeptide (TPR) repeat protein
VPPGIDDQSKLYRSLLADRQALVVLDNARDAAQVLPLLPSSGRVLVTSRHRLDELVARTGARSLGLGQLPEDDSLALLTVLLGARAAAERPELEALARLCGHHPLALRIAAANTGVASLGELVDELRGDPLAQLGFDGAEESAVAKAFSVSYQALPPGLRQTFRLLALVPGADFTAVAAAALLDVPAEEATRRLRGLTAANLLEAHAPRRYRFHDLARRYAERCVEADEDEAARDRAWERLFTGYCAAADAAVALLGARIVTLPREDAPSVPSPVAFADAAAAVAWLDVEVPNLSAALRLAAARGPYPAAWYLADALRRFFHDHGRRAEWLELAPIVLDAARDHGARPAEALVHLSIGGAYFREGQHEAGIRHSEKAVLASRACGWRECEATAVANLGSMLEWTGRLSEAVEHSRRAIQLFRELANSSGEALALNSLSCHYRQLGRLEQAEDCLFEAVALCRKEDLRFWEAANLADLGWVLLETGRFADAADAVDESLREFRDLGSSFGEATALTVRSALESARGDHGPAARTAEAALEHVRRDGDRQAEAAALIALGRAAEAGGDLVLAERVLSEARESAAESGLRGQLAEASATLAWVLAAAGRVPEAGDHARAALDAARAGGYRLLEAQALLGLAAVEAAAGRSTLAEGTAREAWGRYRAVGHVTGEAVAERFLAGLADRATG